MQSLAVPPITSGSAKLLKWPIREVIRLWKIIRGAHKKGNRKRGSHAEGQLAQLLEGRVREKHQKISREVGNLERTIDGTNKMRDISKRPN